MYIAAVSAVLSDVIGLIDLECFWSDWLLSFFLNLRVVASEENGGYLFPDFTARCLTRGHVCLTRVTLKGQ